MTATQQHRPEAGIDLRGILFILYRHKWKILFFSIAGLAAAAAYHFMVPRLYESEAKLLVRYVVERSAIDPVESQSAPTRSSDSVIDEEVEILTSLDLALEVVDAVGMKRLAPNSTAPVSRIALARGISKGLTVVPLRGSNVISISYANGDPELASLVLGELVKRYFIKHLEVHRSVGAFDFVSQQTDQVREMLQQTEDQLKKLKMQAGILSTVYDSTTSIDTSLSKGQEALLSAEADLAEQQAKVTEMEKILSDGAPSQPKPNREKADTSRLPADSGTIQHYQALVERLAELRKTELEMLSKFTPQSMMVESLRGQIASLDLDRRNLEQQFPSLIATAPTGDTSQSSQLDLNTERALLAAAQAKVDTLRAQVQSIETRAARLAEVGTQITQLERKRDAEEANSKYFESSLQKARIDEALDPSKIPNISIIQQPSAAVKVSAKKPVLELAGSGLVLGLAIALFMDLLVDRSIKRPHDLDTHLRIPLLISIPFLPKGLPSSLLQLRNSSGEDENNAANSIQKATRTAPAAWDANHFLRRYADAICDRLILSFHLKNLTHKPKLVGLTGLSGGEGTSTLAAGLAAALSETGDGKVLLVDMHPDRSQAHPFFNGKPALKLSDALEANGTLPPATDKIYLATGASVEGGSMQLAPKRFYDLMPNLRASHFDYVIFDMPPVSQSSATLAVAGCLDKLLLVVEAGKSDQNETKRAYEEFVAAKADVSCILNKTNCTGPKWLVG